MSMIQYGLFPNCSNRCKFCLIKEREFFSMDQVISELDKVIKNIDYIDWENKFDAGISLLGGEIYYITDEKYRQKFLELIDTIIEKILKVSKNPNVRFSTVTNGIYNPENLLFPAIDKIADAVGISKVDVNFSYDLKYRYSSEEDRLLVLENINKFHERYNYITGVQMVLTQHLIEKVKAGEFDVNDFEKDVIPGNWLALLYPHTVRTGEALGDFNFNRKDFIWFYNYLREANPRLFRAFTNSTKNSGKFKHTGLFFKGTSGGFDQPPVLSDGKELINPKCGHSIIYQCYSDSDKCVLCDIESIS